ncbi:hypothetical protein BZJ18_14375 [Salinivibrio sp. IB872]|nr:hypothetical protein BZJ18_14375 [Salinivibrio sp. IB872]
MHATDVMILIGFIVHDLAKLGYSYAKINRYHWLRDSQYIDPLRRWSRNQADTCKLRGKEE